LGLVAHLAATSPVSADPLATYTPPDLFDLGSTGLGSVTQFGFDVHFRPDTHVAGSLHEGTFLIGPGETGTFDFDRSNTVNFDRIAALLTDHVDGFIEFDIIAIGVGAAGNGGLESQELGGLLQGRSVDVLRLIITENVVRQLPSLPGDELDYVWSPRFVWEVWEGTPPPPAPPVPEPAPVALAAVIAVVLAGRRARLAARQ